MGFSLGPIASGLPKDLVQKLVEAEREPIRQMQNKKGNEESRLKLVQELRSRISGITTGLKDIARYRQFRDLGSTVGRPELMDVTVDPGAADPGEYAVEVVQLSGRSSMLSNGFPDPDETWAGSGYFSYFMPDGEEREIYIDLEDSTLNGIASMINNNHELGLQAMVIDDGTGEEDPFRLIITHKNSGELNDAEFPAFYFVDGDQDFYLDEERQAQNSQLKVNGFPVEFQGNKIKDLIPGVTIDLKEAAPGKEFNLAVKEDMQSAEGKVKGLVDKLNEVFSFIQQQNKLDKDSNTQNTLGGDITLQNLEFKMRNIIMAPEPTNLGYIRMGDFGVNFNRNGLLELNEKKMQAFLNNNFEAVAQFLTGMSDQGDGFIGKLTDAVGVLTQPSGMVQIREEGIKNRIRDIDRQIENKERQVAQTEKSIKDRFSKLEGTIANMKQQQASVAATLGGGSLMPNLGG